jgi:hypothetical protein
MDSSLLSKPMLKPIFATLISGCVVAAIAGPPTIGTATSPGDFRVDGATVRGNSTIFDGNTVETASARSVLELNGAQITLSPESRAKVYQDRTVLEQGTSVVRADKHLVEAGTLRISPTAKFSTVQIENKGARQVMVMARAGSAEVRNGSGLLVAKLDAGMAMMFDAAASGNGAARVSGVLKKKEDGKFEVTDNTTHISYELQGDVNLSKYEGQTIEITGSSIPGAGNEIHVTSVKSVKNASSTTNTGNSGSTGTTPSGTGAAGAAGAGAGTHIGAGTIAIIGGVAAGGTMGGLAAAGTFSSGPTASRR